jgi:hypothetical protein
VSYLTTKSVQAWLHSSKYEITAIDTELETAAKEIYFGEFGQRYDTSSWTNASTTPQLVLTVMSMYVASVYLRRAVSQDDGYASYADWLEKRVETLCTAIVNGSIELPATMDTTSSLGGGPLFFPTDDSTALSPNDPESSPRSFTMNMEF